MLGKGRGGETDSSPVVRLRHQVHLIPLQRQAAHGHDEATGQGHQATTQCHQGEVSGVFLSLIDEPTWMVVVSE